MRSPKSIKIKSKRTPGTDAQTTSWEFNTYKSGGSISLPSKEDVIQLIQACDIRYFDHLATCEAYKDAIFVLWENEKGEAPARDAKDRFNYDLLKQLRLEIYHTEGGNQYRKVLGITFHLTGSKNSVVVSSYAAHDWIDFEFPFIKVLVQAIKHGQSKVKMLKKSESEEFPGKITSHPKKKGKLITIHFQDDSNQGESPSAQDPEARTATWDPTVDVPNSDEVNEDDDDVKSDDGNNSIIAVNDGNELPTDTDSLLMQIENLRAENKSLITHKDNLQNQVDNLTARIVQQEHAIETLNYHVNMMRGSIDHISSTKMSKKETKKNSKKLEIEDQSPSNLQFSNGTLNVQKPAKRTDKPWHNVCKSFNKGSCTRKKCKFEHKIVKTCYFYNQPDGCLKGKDCSFLHIKSTKNDTKSQKSQVHQNTLQANAHNVKPRNEMQSAPNDNDNMAMKDSFLEELGRKLLNSWITNQTSQLQPCQPTAYQPLTIAEPQRVIPWQTAPQQQPSQMYVQA